MSHHELTVVISGSMTYTVEGVRYELGAKDAILIPALTERHRDVPDEACDYVSFNFHSEPPELPICMRGACHSEIMLLISAIDRIDSKPHLPTALRAEGILGVILELLSDYERAGRMSPLTRQILEHLHKEYRGRVRLEDIAAVTFFSAEYCESIFKRDVGKSIIDYSIDLKISEAQRLIIEGALSLSEISEQVGFADYNYFSRTFKKRTGYSPTAYRRAIARAQL